VVKGSGDPLAQLSLIRVTEPRDHLAKGSDRLFFSINVRENDPLVDQGASDVFTNRETLPRSA